MCSDKTAGLARFSYARKTESLERLREAVDRIMGERGYVAPSLDDIAQAAGLSRQTLYRHFDGKYALGLDLFEREWLSVKECWRRVCDIDFSRCDVLASWIETLLRHYEGRSPIFRAVIEMSMVEPDFLARAKRIIPDLIAMLAPTIPAFEDALADRAVGGPRWGRAWLITYQLIDQFNAVSAGFIAMDRRLLADLLAEDLHRFIVSAK